MEVVVKKEEVGGEAGKAVVKPLEVAAENVIGVVVMEGGLASGVV